MSTPMHDAFAKLLGDILGRAARHIKNAQQGVSHPPATESISAPATANDADVVSEAQNNEAPSLKEPAS